jgi:hypothetical protein
MAANPGSGGAGRPSRRRQRHPRRETKAKDYILRMLCAPYARLAILALASFGALLPGSLYGQVTSVRIPSAPPLAVELLQHVPMRAGELLTGRLLYPLYVENKAALPAGTIVRGSVIQLIRIVAAEFILVSEGISRPFISQS